jgi:hypothetical protein
MWVGRLAACYAGALLATACGLAAPPALPDAGVMSAQAGGIAPAPDPDPDAAAVYAAILDSLPGPIIVLQDSTARHTLSAVLLDGFRPHLGSDSTASKALLLSFNEANRSSRALPGGITWPRPVHVVGVGKNPDWEDFSARFPGAMGWYAVSAVGYASNRTLAIVHVDHLCGRCSEGRLMLLRREGGTWRVISTDGTWIA